MNKKTFQIFNSRAVLTRAEGGDAPTRIEGYASVFDQPSELMFGVREYIDKDAFNDTDMTDVRALFNHDPNMMLGRTTSGTLEVRVDEKGLFYSVQLPDTQVGNDVAALVERGDISQSSFGFTIEEAAWEVKDGEDVYVIKKVGRLFDVSPVTFPAYPQTSVQARAMRELYSTIQKDFEAPAWRRAYAERRILLTAKTV